MQFRSLRSYLVLGLLVSPQVNAGRHESVEADLTFDAEDKTEAALDLDAAVVQDKLAGPCDAKTMFERIVGVTNAEWTDLFKKIDADGNGEVTGDEIKLYFGYDNVESFFETFDTDTNGDISKIEWEAAWVTLDKNHDGTINVEEWRVFFPEETEKTKELFANIGESDWTHLFTAMDINKDNEVSNTEMRDYFGCDADIFFTKFDVNRDGKISHSEWVTAWNMLLAADADGDGQINAVEWRNAFSEQTLAGVYYFTFMTNEAETEGEANALYAESNKEKNAEIITSAAATQPGVSMDFINTVIISIGSSSTQVYYKHPTKQDLNMKEFYNVGREYFKNKLVHEADDELKGHLEKMVEDIQKLLLDLKAFDGPGSTQQYYVWIENSLGYMARTLSNDDANAGDNMDGVIFPVPATIEKYSEYVDWWRDHGVDRAGVLTGKVLGSFSVAQYSESATFIAYKLKANIAGAYIHNRAKNSKDLLKQTKKTYVHDQLEMTWTDSLKGRKGFGYDLVVDLGGGSWKVFVDGQRIYSSGKEWDTNKKVIDKKSKKLKCGETEDDDSSLKGVIKQIKDTVEKEVLQQEYLQPYGLETLQQKLLTDKSSISILIAMTGKGREAVYTEDFWGASEGSPSLSDGHCGLYSDCVQKGEHRLEMNICRLP